MFFIAFRWFRRFVYLVVAAAFIYFVVMSAQVITASTASRNLPTITGTPVIVVVGSPTGKEISGDLEQRCLLGYALYKDHHAHLLIATGPRSSSAGPSEASVTAECLAKKGIKGVTEVPGGEIPSQLAGVAGMLTPAERQHVVLVADPLQTKWLKAVAEAEGLRAQIAAAPAPKQSFWRDASTIWGQSLAVGSGRLFGYRSTGWIGG
ncbi:MAG: YdcF family protein [Acidimicrobiales bacterium]